MGIDIIEIIKSITANAQSWLPTVTAIVSFIICLFVSIAKVKRACGDIRSDTTIREIKEGQQNEEASNKEMIRLMKMYMDETHKIRRNNNEGESGEKPN